MKRLFISLIALLWFVTLASPISFISKNDVVLKHTIEQVKYEPQTPYHNDVVEHWINFYSNKYDIPAGLMASIFYQESRFVQGDTKYNAHVVGDGGRSFGAGQVQLSTAKAVWRGSETKVTNSRLKYDIKFNVETATKLVAQLRDKYAWNYKTEKEVWLAVLTAYNAGEGYITKSNRFNKYAHEVYNRYKQ